MFNRIRYERSLSKFWLNYLIPVLCQDVPKLSNGDATVNQRKYQEIAKKP
ncbi:hypothetical protein [Nostoc sp. 2RC]|nr:hypothetical protein [Nostoc sp. 2RC]MBC1237681.1 hypothetical protein [Nostoc sp. 2RC]